MPKKHWSNILASYLFKSSVPHFFFLFILLVFLLLRGTIESPYMSEYVLVAELAVHFPVGQSNRNQVYSLEAVFIFARCRYLIKLPKPLKGYVIPSERKAKS